VLEACREIFIALNKHAQTVPKSRLYLLDDRDVDAVAMRSILAEGVDIDGHPPRDRVHASGRLPLALIDWRGESAKFDTGPYVSSVLALHDVVDELMSVPSFASDDYDTARDAVERMEARLDLGNDDGFDRGRLRRAIDRAEEEERPFELPRETVRISGEAFRNRLGERITLPLVGLLPYRSLLERLESAGVLGTTLEPWLSFNETERRTLIAELGVDDPTAAVSAASRDVKLEFPLAFQVVFQRAFIVSLHSMTEQADAVWSYWGFEGSPEDREFIGSWIDRFNVRVAPALRSAGRDSAFYGAGIRLDGTIDYRKTRVAVIAGLITYAMLAPFDKWLTDADDEAIDLCDEIERWLTAKWHEIRPGGRRDPVDGLFSTHGARWRGSVTELIDTKLEEESTDVDDAAREFERIRHGAWQLEEMVAEVRGTAS
jgi:hypothetical protein